MKNRKLAFGLLLMIVGLVLSVSSTGVTGTPLMGVGVVFFLAGMLEVRKEKENKT